MIAQIIATVLYIAGGVTIAASMLTGTATIILIKKKDKNGTIAGAVLTILILFVGIMFFALGKSL